MIEFGREEQWIVVLLVLLVIFWRVQRLDQPIVENYVGRQIPTAMVARNLARGSGFLSPELDTGPFPNRFLVEPPIDAQVVAWISRITSSPLDQVGRAVSAVMTGLAAWGLYLLVHRRSERVQAIAAMLAFAVFPVTIRYGRAFQPDAFTLGATVLGLALWDASCRWHRAIGWMLLTLGISQKVQWSLAILPLMMLVPAGQSKRARIACCATLLPALLWYSFAAWVSGGEGSAASTDNAARWASALGWKAFFEPGRYITVAKDLSYRAFTPIGGLLLLIGLMGWKTAGLLWKIWLVGVLATLLLLFGKLHHDYYWLMVAPPTAAWVGFGMGRLKDRSRWLAAGAMIALVGLGIWQTQATWTTPSEWANAVALGEAMDEEIPLGGMVIAPEAILYLGDRRGCRLEYEGRALVRAANEWRPEPAFAGLEPFDLVEFYRKRCGATFFADVAPGPNDVERRRLHERIKAIPGIWLYDTQNGRFLLVGLPEVKPDPE